jgi:hypothetical protein
MAEDRCSEVNEYGPPGQRDEYCTLSQRGCRIFWPVLVELASPGGVCVWVEVTPLASALALLRLDEIFDMDLAHLLAVVMGPVTFGRAPGPVGPQLAAAAHLAGTTPSHLLLCLLATAALSPSNTQP